MAINVERRLPPHKAAELAFSAGLFEEPGSHLAKALQKAMTGIPGYCVCLSYDRSRYARQQGFDRHPNGVVLMTPHRNVMVYVSPQWRGHGLGSRLVRTLKQVVKMSGPELWANHGNQVEASRRFWRRNRIFIPAVILAEEFQKGIPRHDVELIHHAIALRDQGFMKGHLYRTLG